MFLIYHHEGKASRRRIIDVKADWEVPLLLRPWEKGTIPANKKRRLFPENAFQ
jgi:hypothetical protein